MLAGRAWTSPPKESGGEETPDVLVLYQTGDDSYENWQEGYAVGWGEVKILREYLQLSTSTEGERTIVTKQTYDLTDYNYIQINDYFMHIFSISDVSGEQYVRLHAFHRTPPQTDPEEPPPPPMSALKYVLGSGQMDSRSIATKVLYDEITASRYITYVALTKEYPE